MRPPPKEPLDDRSAVVRFVSGGLAVLFGAVAILGTGWGEVQVPCGVALVALYFAHLAFTYEFTSFTDYPFWGFWVLGILALGIIPPTLLLLAYIDRPYSDFFSLIVFLLYGVVGPYLVFAWTKRRLDKAKTPGLPNLIPLWLNLRRKRFWLVTVPLIGLDLLFLLMFWQEPFHVGDPDDRRLWGGIEHRHEFRMYRSARDMRTWGNTVMTLDLFHLRIGPIFIERRTMPPLESDVPISMGGENHAVFLRRGNTTVRLGVAP